MAAPVLTIADGARMIRSGKVSSRELVESSFETVAECDGSIRAWARLREEGALADADRIDGTDPDERDRLPLAGIPVGIKDIFLTQGLETSAGSPILSGWIPDRDAVAVRHLKEAGAIVLGKTATTAFASADPAITKNPVDLEHSPGGSSAGSAAALAAGMCLGALGTQTAGSIVRPAAYCGVVGFKPTYDAVSRNGVIPLAWSMDHVGPMARTVEDVALLYDVLAGPVGEKTVRTTYTVGLPDRYFEDLDEEVAYAFGEALSALRGRNWNLRSVRLPDSFELGVQAAEVVLPAEIAAVHHDWYEARPGDYGAKLSATIESGRRIAAPSYLRAQRIRRLATVEAKALFEQVDVLVTPTTPTVAPRGFETTGDPRFNIPFSSLGLPTLTVPIPARKTRLPVGLQLAGDHGRDRDVLAAGRLLEHHFGVRPVAAMPAGVGR